MLYYSRNQFILCTTQNKLSTTNCKMIEFKPIKNCIKFKAPVIFNESAMRTATRHTLFRLCRTSYLSSTLSCMLFDIISERLN